VCVLPYNVPQTDRKHKKKMGHKIGIYRAVTRNAKGKMQNYDSLPFLQGNEPGGPNGVAKIAGLKSRGVSGDSPLN
jgi:hypothetical protein